MRLSFSSLLWLCFPSLLPQDKPSVNLPTSSSPPTSRHMELIPVIKWQSLLIYRWSFICKPARKSTLTSTPNAIVCWVGALVSCVSIFSRLFHCAGSCFSDVLYWERYVHMHHSTNIPKWKCYGQGNVANKPLMYLIRWHATSLLFSAHCQQFFFSCPYSCQVYCSVYDQLHSSMLKRCVLQNY